MNKRTRIALLILLLISGGIFLFYFKIRDLETGSHYETKFLMRNLSWQTDFRPSAPYKKGDILEYNWIFSGETERIITMEISPIKSAIDIEHIFLDDREISEKDLYSIFVKDSSLLKITGKAKNTSNNTVPPEPIITTTLKEIAKKEDPQVREQPLVSQAEPSNIHTTQAKYNSNINNLITLSGQNLENVEFVNIGEKRIRPTYSSGALFIQVDRDTFASGEYFVFFTLKNGKLITSEIRLSFEHSDSLINIANITPNIIPNDVEKFIIIQGNGFNKIVSIQLSNNLILKNAEFNIINNQVAGVKIPKDLPPGEYYFNIMDTTAIYELKNIRFTIIHP